MKSSDLNKLLRRVGKERGYKFKSNRCWKRGDDLVRIIGTQPSRWGKAIYINVGLIPQSLIVKEYPPDSGEWGCSIRAEDFSGPFSEAIRDLSGDSDGDIVVDEMADPLAWIFDWIEENWSDETVVRQQVLERSSVLKFSNIYLTRWAKGKI